MFEFLEKAKHGLADLFGGDLIGGGDEEKKAQPASASVEAPPQEQAWNAGNSNGQGTGASTAAHAPAAPTFDPGPAAAALEKAAKGWGTDEAAIHSTLNSLKDPAQRSAVASEFQRRTGRSLDDMLKSELSGDEAQRARAESQGDVAGAAVAQIHQATKGWGTDEHALKAALANVKNAEDATAIRAEYKKRYGVDLDSVIASELSGKEKREVQLMLPKEPGPMFGTPEFEAAMNKATGGSEAKEGNDVHMLFDGVNSFAERHKMIDEAKSSINLQTFIFTDDATGWGLAVKLAQKAQEGVKVRLIYDALGSQRSDPAIFEFMKKAGVEVRPYGEILKDPLDLNSRWHEKHMIVDGASSIEGGMNIADEYALGGTGKKVETRGGADAWRDADVKMTGPSVKDAQQAFLNNWAQVGEPVTPEEESKLLTAPPPQAEDGSSVRVVQHKAHEGDSNIENMYLTCINSARGSITIENAYFIPSEEIRVALAAAALRGVKVRIMTNSRQSNDNTMVADASRSYEDELVAAGVEFHEKQGGTLHAKTASFDGAYAIVGSANMNGRSREHDSEDALGISDPKVAAQLDTRFDAGVKETHEVTGDELANEDFKTNARQKFFSLFHNVF